MDPFLGEIRLFCFPFAPRGWAFCNGQTLPISQNTALYALLGVYYGGDGRSSFGLPNLSSNVAIGMGQGPGLSQYPLGSRGGTPTVTLLANQLANHNHSLNASTAHGQSLTANGNVLAVAFDGGHEKPGNSGLIYSTNPSQATTALDQRSIGLNTGGPQPHNNLQPYLVLNYCIALQGIFPPRP